MLSNKKIEERLDWLTQTVVRIAKNCNVKIDDEVVKVQDDFNKEILELQATIVDLEYQRLTTDSE